MFGETTIFYVMIGNHPIETTIKTGRLEFQEWVFDCGGQTSFDPLEYTTLGLPSVIVSPLRIGLWDPLPRIGMVVHEAYKLVVINHWLMN